MFKLIEKLVSYLPVRCYWKEIQCYVSRIFIVK